MCMFLKKKKLWAKLRECFLYDFQRYFLRHIELLLYKYNTVRAFSRVSRVSMNLVSEM